MKEAPNTSLQEDCSFSSALEKPWSTELQDKKISHFAVESESVVFCQKSYFLQLPNMWIQTKMFDTQEGEKWLDG